MTPAKRKLIRIIVALERVRESLPRLLYGLLDNFLRQVNADLIEVLGEMDPPRRLVLSEISAERAREIVSGPRPSPVVIDPSIEPIW